MSFKKHSKKFDKFITEFFLGSWWVFVFLLICYGSTYHAVKKKSNRISDLENFITALGKEKEVLEEEKENLFLRINSQNDPDWIELVLMRELGVVPKGQKKIYFSNEEK